MAYPTTMNIGEKINVNGIEIAVNYAFTLMRDKLGEFYEINVQTKKITIDKEKIYDFLYYNDNVNNTKHILEWKLDSTKKYIQAKLNNGKYINILNYLTGNLEQFGNRVFPNIQIRNDQPFNFRSSNIMQKQNGINGIKPYNKFKFIPNPLNFFNEETSILQTFQGHIRELGQTGGLERNRYQLITLLKDKDIPNAPKYYQVFLDKKGQNDEEFSFLIDEADIGILSSIRVKNPFYELQQYNFQNKEDSINVENIQDIKEFDSSSIKYNDTSVKQKYIIITNPTWHLYANQYVVMSYNNNYKNQNICKIYYIHRYLLQDQLTEDEYTVDHINGNKLDNRRSNLRAANMTTQNMNRDMVKRKRTLASIINSFAKPGTDIPINLSFDNLEFIIYFSESVKTKKGITIRNGFSIEFKPARCKTEKGIEDSSTQSVIFKDNPFLAIKVKLAHAICIRYLYACKHDNIIKHNIDNKAFANCNEFKSHSDRLITEIMGQTYTIDSFLDYMNTLKIPKYIDSRQTIHSGDTSTNTPTQLQTTIPLATNTLPAIPLKYDLISYLSARNKYDISILIGKDASGGHIKYSKSGCGSDKISLEDKKAFALVQRYNAFVEIENDLNEKNHTQLTQITQNQDQTNPLTNYNTTGLKSLTDFKLEGKSMSSFEELRTHTESLINQLLVSEPEKAYTMETFASYVSNKAASKKIHLDIAKLKYDYSILTR